MIVKKFPQSHLVITNEKGKKLIIDPGYFTFEKGFKIEDFKGADVYLITHQHDDHLGSETIKEIVGESVVYGNQDVVDKLKSLGVANAKAISNGMEFEEAGFNIKAFDLPHFPYPLGNKMPPNTGFTINGVFFHPGDGFELAGLDIKSAALPIGHPFLS